MNPCQLGEALDEITVWYDEDDDGRLEHGCGIGSCFMDSVNNVTGCNVPTNRMAVAIANSNVDGYFKHSNRSIPSTCTTNFNHRLAIGTHKCNGYTNCELDDFAYAGLYNVII